MLRRFTAIVAFLLCVIGSRAGDFGYNAQFKYYFDNYEFDRGGNAYLHSMTINAVNVRLLGGWERNEREVSHDLKLGFALRKDMGQGSGVYAPVVADNPDTWALLNTFYAYYGFTCRTGPGSYVKGWFGVYPSDLCGEEYSRAFVSDSLRFYDDAYEGMLFQFASRHTWAELWLDWMGLHGTGSRERFRVAGAFRYRPWKWLQTGIDASMYHFAGSTTTPGVVDNILANPYVKADFGPALGIRELSLKAGALLGYQRDRRFGSGTILPAGGEIVLRGRVSSFGLDNTFYFGDDQMPLYDNTAYGHRYAADLYFGSPFYRCGLFDRLEVFYAPRISSRLDLKISAVFHFADDNVPYQGTQQILSIRYSL